MLKLPIAQVNFSEVEQRRKRIKDRRKRRNLIQKIIVITCVLAITSIWLVLLAWWRQEEELIEDKLNPEIVANSLRGGSVSQR
mmetsp:Transcript_1056/g.1315  ORF Transcript_1056/g.1315 Transcript_1056/m.1315 type:complete len:83 (-) Transcript_1056:261-509(-)